MHYSETTDTYFGDMTDWEPTDGVRADAVNTLVGFGYGFGIDADKKQCMMKRQYVPDSKQCEINPAYCSDGLSFSIWAQVQYDMSVYNMSGLNQNDEQYFMSTGPDKDGRPGIAIGIKKQWLFALVSNGSHYWYTEILGPIANNTWNNVGIRWNASEGMEVFVNDSKAGSTDHVEPTPGEKPSHSPPLLMVGCHKTAADTEFRGYMNGALDEVAIWPEKLELLENNGTVKFLGGYTEDIAAIDADLFASMIEKVALDNPGQQAAAVKILEQLTNKPDPITTPAPSPDPNSSTLPSVESNVTTKAPEPAGVKELKTLAKILMTLLDESKLPQKTTQEEAESFLKVTQSLSNVLASKNNEKWKQIQDETEKLGIIQLVNSFRSWHAKLVQTITFTNVTKPFCYEKVEQNIYIKYCKMRVEDLEAMARRIQLPDYTQPSLKKYREICQEMLIDRIAFPTSVFTDLRCKKRPVGFTFHYYRSAHEAAVTTTNPVHIPNDIRKTIDARLMNFELRTDFAVDDAGDIDTSTQLCDIDQEEMEKTTNLVKSGHIVLEKAKVTPVRRLHLFENMTISTVKQRFCVWWNPNLTDFGAWDKTGCEITETTEEYSKCQCNNFAIVTIMASRTEPIEVPEEPYWLIVVKYILYGISALAIIIYITVVMISGNLKDQYHLIGLNLAVAILLGSIVMVASDIDSFTSTRLNCTIIGTLLHFFYGAVGAWMFGLGHAAFSGITSGVIGGRLGVYAAICWGIPVAGVGIPYLFMLPELGYDPRCFIGWENSVKWVFFGPQLVSSIASIFFAAVVICNLSTPALRKENLIEDYGSFCRGAAFLLLHLALVWIFGLFAYIRFGFTEPNFYPAFQVFNALSGLCLLCFIGFGSLRFRSVLIGQAKQRRSMLKQYAFGRPTEETENLPNNDQSNPTK